MNIPQVSGENRRPFFVHPLSGYAILLKVQGLRSGDRCFDLLPERVFAPDGRS